MCSSEKDWVYVCVCVCVREREGYRMRDKEKFILIEGKREWVIKTKSRIRKYEIDKKWDGL